MLITAVAILLAILFLVRKQDGKMFDCCITFIVGVLFALGLGFGGMLKRSKILGFLVLSKNWDPVLLILFMTSVGANMVTFHFILNK